MWDTNKIPRQGICTIYLRPLAPLEYWKVPLLGLLLAWAWKPGQVNRHASTHAPDGNSARKTGSKKEWHGGISLSGNWSHFFILGFAYIPFVTHRDEYRVMQGSAVLTFIKIRCFTWRFYIIFWPWGLLTFYDPFFLITKKLVFFQGCFFLNQAPPSK